MSTTSLSATATSLLNLHYAILGSQPTLAQLNAYAGDYNKEVAKGAKKDAAMDMVASKILESDAAVNTLMPNLSSPTALATSILGNVGITNSKIVEFISKALDGSLLGFAFPLNQAVRVVSDYVATYKTGMVADATWDADLVAAQKVVAARPVPQAVGQSFTLTTDSNLSTGGADNLVGTTLADAFNAYAYGSLGSADVIRDPSSADADVLAANYSLADTGATTVLVQPIVSNVETIKVGIAGADDPADEVKFSGSNISGLKALEFNNLNGVTAGHGAVTLTGFSKAVMLSATGGDGYADVNVTFSDTVSGGADEASISLSAGKLNAVTLGGVETVNLVATSGKSTIASLTDTSTTKVVASGAGTLTLKDVTGSTSLKTIDASAMTGSVSAGASATPLPTSITSIVGGAGNDSFTFNGNLATTDTLDGGAGRDTLAITGGLSGSYSKVSNIEVVSVSDTNNYNLASITGLSEVYSTTTGGGFTVTNMPAAAKITVTGDAVTTLSAAAAAAASTLDVALNNTPQGSATAANADGVDIATLSTANVTTLNINSTGQSYLTSTATTGVDNSAGNINASKVVLTGEARTTLTTTGTTTTSVDASAFTGRSAITVAGGQAVTIMGGTGIDAITAGTGNDMLTGGSGNDTIAGAGGKDSISGGDGADTITTGATAATDVTTISGGAGNDSINITPAGNFNASGDEGDDSFIIDSNFNSLDSINGGDGVDSIRAIVTNGNSLDLTSAGGIGLSSLVSVEGAIVDMTSLTAGQSNTLKVDDVFIASSGGTTSLSSAAGSSATSYTSLVNPRATLNVDAQSVLLSTSKLNFTAGPLNVYSVKVGNATENITLGGGNDTVTVGTATAGSSGFLAGADSIDAGSGSDTLVFAEQAKAAYSTAALTSVKGFETISVNNANNKFTLTITDGFVAANRSSSTGALSVSSVLGTTADQVYDGSGVASANKLSLSGNGGADTLLGGAGADTLSGGAGADSLSGGAGADQLTGGTGADALSGGAGNDTFVFAFGDSTATAVDTIVDWEATDKLVLTGTSPAAGVIDVTANGNQFSFTGGTLVVGNTSGWNIALATSAGASVGVAPNKTNVQFGSSTSAPFTLANGTNTFKGGDFGDFIAASTLADNLTGGDGNDTFIIDASTSSVSVPDTITDFVTATGNSSNIDRLQLTFNTTTVSGTDTSVTKFSFTPAVSSASGANTIGEYINLGANSTLTVFSTQSAGGAAAGSDLRVITTAVINADDINIVLDDLGGTFSGGITTGGGNDRVGTSATSLTTAIINVANIVLGAGNDSAAGVTGGTASHTISGGDGNDVIYGGGGADSLSGGAGSDTFGYVFVSATGPVYTDSSTTGGLDNIDRVIDFTSGIDKISVGGHNYNAIVGTGGIATNTVATAGATVADLDTVLGTALAGTVSTASVLMAAGGAALVKVTGASLAGTDVTYLVIDSVGIGSLGKYDAGVDMVIALVGASSTALSIGDFSA